MSTSQHGLQHKVVRTTVEKGLAPRQFNFVISSETLDRDKDIINLDAWDLREYEKNPVVLASHAHQSLPVGKSVSIGVRGDKLKATVQFPDPGVYDYADTVHDMVAAGFLNAASVGFRSDDAVPNGLGGMTIKKATLLEWSICAIGSNPDALVQRAAPLVMQKWLQAQHKEGPMKSGDWIEITDGIDEDLDRKVTTACRRLAELVDIVETKDRSPFEIMCDSMLANYSEMDSEKFRQLMAIQLALLGPAATIYDLVQALQSSGVFAPPRSAPRFRVMSLGEQINEYNANNLDYQRRTAQDLSVRQRYPSFSMR